MLLLFSNPRVGLSLALETGVSAREGADLVDVDGKRAVRFRDGAIISHASDMVCSRASANRGQSAAVACYNQTDPLPNCRCRSTLSHSPSAASWPSPDCGRYGALPRRRRCVASRSSQRRRTSCARGFKIARPSSCPFEAWPTWLGEERRTIRHSRRCSDLTTGADHILASR